MAHLTLFDSLENYNAYINSEDFVLPNITYCEENKKVHYMINITPVMSAVFTIGENDSLDVKIAGNTKGIFGMRIDGVVLEKPVTNYTFTDVGEHTVEYQFTDDSTAIPTGIFNKLDALSSVDLTNITDIGDYNFYQCYNMVSIGGNVINANIGKYSFYGTKISDITELVINGNVGDNALYFASNYTISALTINGNVGNNNMQGNGSTLKKLIINGNLGNGNLGGTALQELYIKNNVGNSNFGGVNSITALTIDGTEVGNANYFYGFDTLHIKGNLGSSNYINEIKHVIVDGNMGHQNSPGGGCLDLTVSGDIGDSTFGGTSTLSGITIGGSIGNSNFSGCGPLNEISIGGNIGNSNFNNYYGHQFKNVIIGTDGDENTGNVGSSNYFTGSDDSIENGIIHIYGNINGNGNSFNSTNTITIDGNINGQGNTINGSITNLNIGGNINCTNGYIHSESIKLTNNCNRISTGLTNITSLIVEAATPPTLMNNASLAGSNIYVPSNYVETYKSDTAWGVYSANIQAIPTE